MDESKKKKLKKIVAREGLIVICFVAAILGYPAMLWNMQHFIPEIGGTPFSKTPIAYIGGMLILWGYPVFIIIRFVRWAIRTLREK